MLRRRAVTQEINEAKVSLTLTHGIQKVILTATPLIIIRHKPLATSDLPQTHIPQPPDLLRTCSYRGVQMWNKRSGKGLVLASAHPNGTKSTENRICVRCETDGLSGISGRTKLLSSSWSPVRRSCIAGEVTDSTCTGARKTVTDAYVVEVGVMRKEFSQMASTLLFLRERPHLKRVAG
jgi:hypothetical protein